MTYLSRSVDNEYSQFTEVRTLHWLIKFISIGFIEEDNFDINYENGITDG